MNLMQNQPVELFRIVYSAGRDLAQDWADDIS